MGSKMEASLALEGRFTAVEFVWATTKLQVGHLVNSRWPFLRLKGGSFESENPQTNPTEFRLFIFSN